MAYKISKVNVWAGPIDDKPGGLASILETLTASGANLEFIVGRRTADLPGQGVVFLAPLTDDRQIAVAAQVGLTVAESLCSLRIEGPDSPGIVGKVTRVLAQAGINLRGLTAAEMGSRSVIYFAFDSCDDAHKAGEILQDALPKL